MSRGLGDVYKRQAKNYTIVPMLFLKNASKDGIGSVMLLPENIINLTK